MLFNLQKFFLILCVASAALAVPTVRSTLSSAAIFPISGDQMGALTPLPTGETWFFYQASGNNSIIAVRISDALAEGGTVNGDEIYVPGSEVQSNSPIAVSGIANAAGDSWEQIHVFFVSPENILSEYHFTADIGIQGGPSCTACVTSEGFVVTANSQMLYAIETSTEVRVGFVSAGSPNTVSEAVSSGNGWSVASLT